VVSKERKSGVLRKAASVLKLSKRSLYRHLKQAGEEDWLAETRRLLDLATGDEFLTVSEVARFLKCSRSAVYRWAVMESRIPYYTISKSIRILKSDLLQAIEHHEALPEGKRRYWKWNRKLQRSRRGGSASRPPAD
jgi:excisionase family DNA binding protein